MASCAAPREQKRASARLPRDEDPRHCCSLGCNIRVSEMSGSFFMEFANSVKILIIAGMARRRGREGDRDDHEDRSFRIWEFVDNVRALREDGTLANWRNQAIFGVVIAGGVAVGIADETLDLHMAEDMAAVQVDPTETYPEQLFDMVVHEIGSLAVDVKEEF